MDAYNGTGYASVDLGVKNGCCEGTTSVHRLDPVEAPSDANAAAAGATSTLATAVAMSCRTRKASLYHRETQMRLLGCSKLLR